MLIEVGSEFTFDSSNGLRYILEVTKIDHITQEPSKKYALYITDPWDIPCGPITFVGDDFFQKNENKIKPLKRKFRFDY